MEYIGATSSFQWRSTFERNPVRKGVLKFYTLLTVSVISKRREWMPRAVILLETVEWSTELYVLGQSASNVMTDLLSNAWCRIQVIAINTWVVERLLIGVESTCGFYQYLTTNQEFRYFVQGWSEQDQSWSVMNRLGWMRLEYWHHIGLLSQVRHYVFAEASKIWQIYYVIANAKSHKIKWGCRRYDDL